jgi:2-oxo-3-hexenedioate decarboxylase
MPLHEHAETLYEARRKHQPIPQLTVGDPSLSVSDAYFVQSLLTGRSDEVGYKMGLTSLAKQREVGVSSPIRGRLLAEDGIADGAIVNRRDYIHPRAEPEIVFLLKNDLPAGSPPAAIQSAIASIHIGIEVIDSRYRDFRFTLPDVIADNASAAGYVIGGVIDCTLNLLPRVEVWLVKNTHVVQRAPASAILGDPFRSLEELLKLTPDGVCAGPVLAGGVTQSVPFEAGDTIEVGCATGAHAWFRVV